MALTASVSRGASTGLTQSPPSSPPPGLQAGITRSSYYTLYRCSAAEEKLETLSSDAPTDAYLTPVSAFLKGKVDKLHLYQDGDIATIAKDSLYAPLSAMCRSASTGALNPSRPPVVCFFQPLPIIASAASASHVELVVCLMTSHSSAEYFELMKQDMHIFVTTTYTAWKRSNAAPEVLATLFVDWYPKPVNYVPRLLQQWSSRDALAAFLHLVLTSSRVFVCAPEPAASELTRLIERISLSHLVQSRGEAPLVTVVASAGASDRPLITVEASGAPVLSATASNAFCKTWALRLHSTSDPLLLCGIIQHTKDLLVQELNSTKRLLNAARMDHYELFRLFQRLKTHDNTDVIVPMLQSDTGDKDTKEVLSVLSRCLAEQCGPASASHE